jgi:N4-gp56 family major capsid protein
MASLPSGGIQNSTLTKDQEKFLSAQLLANAHQRLVAKGILDEEKQPNGTGTTAYFVRYKRMYVPVAALTEGTDPSSSTFELEEVTVSLDQWGDFLTITDVAQLTAKHPVMQRAMALLADNAQRVMDREVQIVWLAGTNVQYGDASVTSRSAITSGMKVTDAVIQKARITLGNNGAQPHGGKVVEQEVKSAASAGAFHNRKFVAICGLEVEADIAAATNFVAVAQYQNAKAIYNAEVGEYLGVRWVATNFIARFTLLGNATTAVVSGAASSAGISGMVITAVDGGGSLTSATTYYFKITRKDLTRGFEEAISIEHTMSSAATGNNESFTFALPSTAGYVYNVYFGSATGDSNLKLAAQNQAAGATVTVTSVPTSTTTAPANILSNGTVSVIHPVYVIGAEATGWVGLQNLSVKVSTDQTTTDNPLGLRKTVGYKFMGKTVIKNQSFMMRLEVASAY